MKSTGPQILCVWVICSAPVNGQPSYDTPDQFYTNGIQIDGWTADEANGQMVSLWFGKDPKDSVSYRQLIAIVKDNDPSKVLYYDLVAKRYVGRYDMDLGKYSLLAPENRKRRLEDIDESMFPPPGEKPAIGELFDPPADGPPSDEQLMMPPATMKFPRLEQSTWDSHYTTANGQRIRVNLRFDGHRGRYDNDRWDRPGVLSNVQFLQRGGMHMVEGCWQLNGHNGRFQFRIPMNDLNSFEGDWGFRTGTVEGIWDAKRTSR